MKECTTEAAVAYAFALNCSLDCLMIWPIVTFKIAKSVTKHFHEDLEILHDLNLRPTYWRAFVNELYSAYQRFLVALVLPWLPFIYTNLPRFFHAVRGLFSVYYDPI